MLSVPQPSLYPPLTVFCSVVVHHTSSALPSLACLSQKFWLTAFSHSVLHQLPDYPSALLYTKSKSLLTPPELLRNLPSSLWCSDLSSSPCCTHALCKQAPLTCSLASQPAFPVPSLRHFIPIEMPGMDLHGLGLSVFCTVHLTCLQPDAKLIQPRERVPSTLMDFK